MPSKGPQAAIGGQSAAAKGPSTAARTDLESCRLGNCTFGKLQLGKIPLGSCNLGKYPWEVATWENTLGKLQLGKNPFGKYQTSTDPFIYSRRYRSNRYQG